MTKCDILLFQQCDAHDKYLTESYIIALFVAMCTMQNEIPVSFRTLMSIKLTHFLELFHGQFSLLY